MNESENIKIEGTIPPIKVNIEKREVFYHGGKNQKWKLEGTVGKNKDLQISLIERNFGKIWKTDWVIDRWTEAKEAGLDVVDILQKTDKGTVVMTNVRADGSETYGKSLFYYLTDPEKVGEIRQPSKLDDAFLEIMDNADKLQEIEEKAMAYANLAAEHGIILSRDDPLDLVLHPDKDFRLMCIDIENMGKLNVTPDGELDFAKESNKNKVKTFMSLLKQSAEELRKTREIK